MLLTDIVRLLAVPVFAWVALSDHRTNTVPAAVWPPLAAVGGVLLAVDVAAGRPGVLANAAVGVGFMVAVVSVYNQLGTWGAADTKAFLTLAVLFPVPPGVSTALSVFPVTVFLNSMLLAGAYVAAIALLDGEIPKGVPFLVPTFAGLLAAIVYGDILLALVGAF